MGFPSRPILMVFGAGWSSPVARQAHNLKVESQYIGVLPCEVFYIYFSGLSFLMHFTIVRFGNCRCPDFHPIYRHFRRIVKAQMKTWH